MSLGARNGSAILKDPIGFVYPSVKELQDVVCNDRIPFDLSVESFVMILTWVPGIKYWATRQLPLTHEQRDIVEDFFRAKHADKFFIPHRHLCQEAEWQVAHWHAYNKLNAVTTLAQTPITRKDDFLNAMVGCTKFSTLDIVDEYYQLLMQANDTPPTMNSTPSGVLS